MSWENNLCCSTSPFSLTWHLSSVHLLLVVGLCASHLHLGMWQFGTIAFPCIQDTQHVHTIYTVACTLNGVNPCAPSLVVCVRASNLHLCMWHFEMGPFPMCPGHLTHAHSSCIHTVVHTLTTVHPCIECTLTCIVHACIKSAPKNMKIREENVPTRPGRLPHARGSYMHTVVHTLTSVHLLQLYCSVHACIKSISKYVTFWEQHFLTRPGRLTRAHGSKIYTDVCTLTNVQLLRFYYSIHACIKSALKYFTFWGYHFLTRPGRLTHAHDSFTHTVAGTLTSVL